MKTKLSSGALRQAGVSLWALVPLLLGALLTGCAAPPAAPTEDMAFDEAAAAATDKLIAQTQKLPVFMLKLSNRAVVVDPMFDNPSGQQTALTRRLEERVSARLRAAQFEVLPFQPAHLGRAHYLLTGTLTRVPTAQTGHGVPFQIDLALTDITRGTVLAQSSARARDDQLDTTPTPYYRDSPILVKDAVVDGYIHTSATAPGQRADPAYFERVSTAATINEATQLYNNDRPREALELYKTALAAPSGAQMRTLNGIYLSSLKLGRNSEAEQAFSKVVEHGIANSNLGVKFLFNPNTTEFWSDPKVSGPYPLWLRQIARQSAQAKVCMEVVGHTSRTGSAPYNDKLSEQRATAIRQRLSSEAPELMARTKASGVGFRENIVGTGTDDASDALDRRVEFKIVPCAI
jgi:outer membrane protein OmpA-like peptidoglycan-associated protein